MSEYKNSSQLKSYLNQRVNNNILKKWGNNIENISEIQNFKSVLNDTIEKIYFNYVIENFTILDKPLSLDFISSSKTASVWYIKYDPGYEYFEFDSKETIIKIIRYPEHFNNFKKKIIESKEFEKMKHGDVIQDWNLTMCQVDSYQLDTLMRNTFFIYKKNGISDIYPINNCDLNLNNVYLGSFNAISKCYIPSCFVTSKEYPSGYWFMVSGSCNHLLTCKVIKDNFDKIIDDNEKTCCLPIFGGKFIFNNKKRVIKTTVSNLSDDTVIGFVPIDMNLPNYVYLKDDIREVYDY